MSKMHTALTENLSLKTSRLDFCNFVMSQGGQDRCFDLSLQKKKPERRFTKKILRKFLILITTTTGYHKHIKYEKLRKSMCAPPPTTYLHPKKPKNAAFYHSKPK